MTPAKSLVRSSPPGKLFLAGIGCFAGPALRYAITGFVQNSSSGNTRFPFGTLTVNLVGGLLIGFLSELAEVRGIFNADTRTLIFVGLLGGFTTFSAFGNGTMNLWRGGEGTLAFAFVLRGCLVEQNDSNSDLGLRRQRSCVEI